MKLVKPLIEQRRPVGSCLTSCGMPSGHSLNSISLLTWLTCEIFLAQAVSSGQRIRHFALVLLLLGPVGWSRTCLRDHSWAQVGVGSSLGLFVGCAWAAFLRMGPLRAAYGACCKRYGFSQNYPVEDLSTHGKLECHDEKPISTSSP